MNSSLLFKESQLLPNGSLSTETLVMEIRPPLTNHHQSTDAEAMKKLSRPARLLILSSFTFAYFLVELIVGYAAGSIALVADSFHMLSDVISLGVAYYALLLASKSTATTEYSYGLQRAEVLGALMNGVSLLTLCFTIAIEAIQRFFEPVHIETPILVISVGAVGLAFNLLGMAMFHEHAHHHHHGGHSHAHKEEEDDEISVNSERDLEAQNILRNKESQEAVDEGLHSRQGSHLSVIHPALVTRAEIIAVAEKMSQEPLNRDTQDSFATSEDEINIEVQQEEAHDHSFNTLGNSHDHLHGHYHGHGHSHSHGHSHDHGPSHSHGHTYSHGPKEGHLNDHGVFLHILGDALGSVAVILSSIVIIYAQGDWKYYADPIFSLLITGMIVFSTVPLVKSAAFILLQGVPSSIRLDKVRHELMRQTDVVGVHELHVWQLSDVKSVASVHVSVREPPKDRVLQVYQDTASMIKKTLHKHGIHSTTVQTEFVNVKTTNRNSTFQANEVNGKQETSDELACLLTCGEKSCETQVCCPPSSTSPTTRNTSVTPNENRTQQRGA